MWGASPLSFDRLVVLVRALPDESQTARALGAPRPGQWAAGEYLLALIADQAAIANHLFVRAHVKKGTPVPAPKMVPRPGDVTQERRRPATPEELASALRRGRGTVRYRPRGEG